MRLIPVLDVLGGRVVRAVAGRRAQYQPVRSIWSDSAQPRDVAQGLFAAYRPAAIYVADLDAITTGTTNHAAVTAVAELGCPVWIDAGLRAGPDACPPLQAGAFGVVAGLETVQGPAALADIVAEAGAERVALSIDLRGGVLMGDATSWDARGAAATAVSLGVRRLIVLDLSDVGTGRGVSTLSLCRGLRREWPGVEVWAGGGVRDADDLRALADAGVNAALVASALHDGRIAPGDWDCGSDDFA